jgi:hypothetical protein
MESTFSFFTTFLTLLPEVAVVGLCIYYFSAKKTVDGLLLSIGSGIGLLLSAFFRLIPIIDSTFYQELASNNIFMITSTVGFLSSACFAAGLGMLIMNIINPVKK